MLPSQVHAGVTDDTARREGKTKREALRALKRFIVRAIWRQWEQCQDTRSLTPAVAA